MAIVELKKIGLKTAETLETVLRHVHETTSIFSHIDKNFCYVPCYKITNDERIKFNQLNLILPRLRNSVSA